MAVDVLGRAVDLAMIELKRRKKAANYFNDPVAWVHDIVGGFMWSKQREISAAVIANKNTAVKAGHGIGKALSLNTRLPTPTGWTTMGDVRVGDLLLDENGKPTRVIAISDTWHEDTYRVTFDDGTSIDCSGQHEWSVIDIRHRPKRNPVVDWRNCWSSTTTLETRDLFKSVEFNGQKRWRIPLNKPLELPHAKLEVDPYVFGAWLGDGSSKGASITTHPDDYEILARFEQAGYVVRKMSNKYLWSFSDKGAFVSFLRKQGVYNNKFIPATYLRSSIEQRQDLLRGILDTDGHISGQGGITIDLCSESLARGVVELVRSLGGKVTIHPHPATLYGRVVGTRWRMSIRVTDFNPFYLTRKADRWHAPNRQASRYTQKTIVSVERIDTVATRCVTVDSPRHLFLAGESMVPTHNSRWAALLICWWIDTRYPHVFVATTAPSQAQVGAILWREVRAIKKEISARHREYLRREKLGLPTDGYPDHELPGYITAQNEWKEDGGNILGFGRKPPENKEDDSFQGLHDAAVLAIGDEAVGLTEQMIDALGNITSNQGSKRVLIANPTNPASHFGKLFRDPSGAWSLHTISVLDSPNFTDEKDELPQEILDKLTGPEYVEDKKKEYGEDSPRYKSRVLGEFAYDLGDTLIKPEDIAVAVDTDIVPMSDEPVKLGVDVARFGKDSSVIYCNQGGRLRYVDHYAGETRVTQVASWVNKWAVDLNATEVRVDGNGIGGGVIDEIVAQYPDRRYTLIAMNSNGTSPDRRKWHNNRAYWWDQFRLDLRSGKIDMDQEDTEFEKVQDEMTMVGYGFSKTSGGLLIESKDEMKKRGVKSPDFADAAIYACADSDFLFNSANPKKQQFFQELGDIIGELPDYLRLMTDWA